MNKTRNVNMFMQDLKHPLKSEIEVLRKIIKSSNIKICERIKWNAPSYYYGKYDFGAFNLRETKKVHLVLVFPNGIIDDSSGLLEGDYEDRRMVYFYSLEDIEKKTNALQSIVNKWIDSIHEKIEKDVTNTSNNNLPKIGAPATRALALIGVFDLSGVAKLSEKELNNLHGVGPKAIRILKEELNKIGKAFK